jgi:hypothetical protein
MALNISIRTQMISDGWGWGGFWMMRGLLRWRYANTFARIWLVAGVAIPWVETRPGSGPHSLSAPFCSMWKVRGYCFGRCRSATSAERHIRYQHRVWEIGHRARRREACRCRNHCAVHYGCFVRISGPNRRMDGALMFKKRPNDGCGARCPGSVRRGITF